MIKKNPKWSEQEHKEFADALARNKGHCPCSLIISKDTLCPCKEFREQESGECHCGRFVKETED